MERWTWLAMAVALRHLKAAGTMLLMMGAGSALAVFEDGIEPAADVLAARCGWIARRVGFRTACLDTCDYRVRMRIVEARE